MTSNEDTSGQGRNGPCSCDVYVYPLIYPFIQKQLLSSYHFSGNVVGATSENISIVEAGSQKAPVNNNKYYEWNEHEMEE